MQLYLCFLFSLCLISIYYFILVFLTFLLVFDLHFLPSVLDCTPNVLHFCPFPLTVTMLSISCASSLLFN